MDKLPLHKATQFSDFGIRLRRMGFSQDMDTTVTDIHQNDYYIFGLVENGTGCGFIDFKEQHFSSGDVFLIQPGQAHRLVSPGNAEGWMLLPIAVCWAVPRSVSLMISRCLLHRL